ncbi:pirin family protein [uncultured Sphingomonas sp.]|uniref:pirin family protein n=1 Tax=uncultured Sphingomonas sp. TaxID=158754 RepID=UPI0035CADF7F
MTTPRRTIVGVTPAPHMLEGEGFVVRRPVPARALEAIGPFIMLDHMGPVLLAPGEAKGAPTHPHAGMETLTYLLEGRGHHLDSLGNFSVMGAGDVQWMRAGSGIVHDEGPDAEARRDGGRVHALQLWIDLPRPHRQDPPAYRQFGAAEIPVLAHAEGVTLRLIAGRFGGVAGPVETYADPFLLHVELVSGASTGIDPEVAEIAAYVLRGEGRIDDRMVGEGDFVRFAGTGGLDIAAGGDGLDLILVGGPPLAEPIVRHGPFVMNTPEELQAAVDDYRAGRFGTIRRPALIDA